MDNSLNNKAWKKIFDKYDITNKIAEYGIFEITSKQINEFRESRLMTKFDSLENLPEIFSKNDLTILPTKRGSYVIGNFDNYSKITIDNDLDIEYKGLPEYISSIDISSVTSEAVSLSCAYVSGMIEEIIGEEVVPTIQGRMGTGTFNFFVNSNNSDEVHNISVENSQMEIDGAYESENKFVIVEAKNHYMDNFIIRQLYYPYKVWKEKLNKEIIPMMLIKHDNIYNFFIYEFADPDNYNSIVLKNTRRFILNEVYKPIELEDVLHVFNNVEIVNEKDNVPFPQADSFPRVLDILNVLKENQLTAIEISDIYEFDIRQAHYYLAAARYLGLVMKSEGSVYGLTELGQSIQDKKYKERNLDIISTVLSHKPFNVAFKQYIDNHEIDSKVISDVILDTSVNVNERSTADRRTQTVKSWINWIVDIIK